MTSNSSISIRTLWPVFALLATLAWASSYSEGVPQSPDVPHFDKIAHFFIFGLIGTLWFRSLPGRVRKLPRWLLAFILAIVYGVIDEWIQSHNPNRSSEMLDWVADASGAITAIFVYRSWRLYRQILETPIGDLFRLKVADIE